MWEMEYVKVAGPPVEERRCGIGRCWLCNATLNVHERKWTRPGWKRTVSWSESGPQLPYERLGEGLRASIENDRIRVRNMARTVCTYATMEPPSQLDMSIYNCPNGCDADDTLQPLLDQMDHTGPERAPRRQSKAQQSL